MKPLHRSGFRALLFCLLVTVPVRAEETTPAEMRSVCRAWLDHRIVADGTWAGSRDPEIVGERAITHQDRVIGSAFGIAPQGFIVVPACKTLSPVFYFSETGSLEALMDPVAGPVLSRRLALATELAAAGEGLSRVAPATPAAAAAARNRSRWAQMTGTGSGGRELRPAPAVSVGPLLTTAWHQGLPFNLLCPIGRNGQRCVAGCAAIAAAQIARFHAHPADGGIGMVDFYWDGDHCGAPPSPGALLHADFSDLYDWSLMPDVCFGSCGGEADSAAAELCYELGVAAHTDYGTTCGSLAVLEQMVLELQEHFGYEEPTEAVYRWNFPDAHSWFVSLRNEINFRHPVLYSLTYWSGGQHILVCDGWRIENGIEFLGLNLGAGSVSGWYAVDDNSLGDRMQDYAILHLAPPDHVVSVGPSGQGDYPDIQSALDAENPGAIIELLDGLFTGPGNRDLRCWGKPITIRSLSGSPELCVIDCQGSEVDPHRAFVLDHAETAYTVIEGITLCGGRAPAGGEHGPAPGGAVICGDAASPTIRNCVFSANHAGRGGAIGCVGSASPLVENCVFRENTAQEGGACAMAGPGEAWIVGSTFFGNGAPAGSALQVGAGSALVLERSIVAGNLDGAAVDLAASGAAQLECCDLFGNEGGDWTGGIAGQLGQSGNISADPMFCDAAAGDLRLNVTSPCAQPACGRMGARPPGCGEFVYYVGAAPEYSYHTIAAALADAREWGRIVLMDSLYTGDGNRDLHVQRSHLTIESAAGVPEACVLDAQGSAADEHYGFFVEAQTGVTIRGLTVRRAQSQFGGGVQIFNSDSTRILDCVFRDCANTLPTSEGGAGVLSYVEEPYPGRLTISGCRFESCAGGYTGGAVSLIGDAGTDTTIIDHCTFDSNTAYAYGGAVAAPWGARFRVRNCVFEQNSAPNGGIAVLAGGSVGWFESCTMVGSAAATAGGCVYVYDAPAQAILSNCIIASTTGRPPFECFTGNISATCCDFWQNQDSTWTGCAEGVLDPENHNIFLDPQFCDPPNRDWRLAATSPCAPGQPGNPGCGLVGALPADCSPSSGVSADETEAAGPALLRCAPNPLGRETRVGYALPAGATGRAFEISIYDVGGRRVRSLMREMGRPGWRWTTWNTLDDLGRPVGSGLYFCRLQVGTEVATQRIIVVR